MADENKPLTWIVEDDGSETLIDHEQFESDAKKVAAGLLMMHDETGRKHIASSNLREIHMQHQSSAYTRVVLLEAMRIMDLYLAEEAGTFQMPIILGNLNNLLLAYRTMRPDPK